MSDATSRLRAFLTISPSVVFPDEVLELFKPVEKEVTRLSDENSKLRELVYDMLVDEERGHNDDSTFDEHVERANELGVRLYG